MPAPRPTVAQLRFAPAGSLPEAPQILTMPREEGLALLDWLGLGRPEFGAIAARELAPRCRRRLWDVYSTQPTPRWSNDAGRRARTGELLALALSAARSGEGMVMFG